MKTATVSVMPSASRTVAAPKLNFCKVSRRKGGPSIVVPRAVRSLADFRNWVLSDDFPEKVRATYVDHGIYVDMSEEELNTHAADKESVCRVLSLLNQRLRLGRFFFDGVFVTNEDADVSNNPDGVLISYESVHAGRVRFEGRQAEFGRLVEIVGTPDWILEIVSKSSVTKDLRQLRDAYHRAGILECWLIDARRQEISFQILTRKRSGYAPAAVQNGWQQSKVFRRAFKLTRNRDEIGLWEYTLHVKTV